MALIQNIVNFQINNEPGKILNSNENYPWIQIIKKENCFDTDETFPQVKLISRNLYVENSSGLFDATKMWGFPLFDISGSSLRDSTTWTFFNSASVSTTPTLTRLDLSRNLVVLDFQNLIPYRSNLKYLVIQLHTSQEILTDQDSNYKWYNYIYTGNLINPYDKLDFTAQFAVDINNTSLANWFNIIGQDGNEGSLDAYIDLFANILCEPEYTTNPNSLGSMIISGLCDLSSNSNFNTFNNNYDLNNLLWFSLRSSSFIESSTIAFNSTRRYIKNFTKVNGGGYQRDKGTMQLPRITSKPYGSLDTSDISFAPQNGEEMATYSDITNYFDIEFKPLIMPEGSLELEYTFGKQHGTKVTFVRDLSMDGIPYSLSPSRVQTGKTFADADRNSELINLSWSAGDQSKKSIRLVDIASGFNKVPVTISQTGDTFFSDIVSDSTNYDISSNIFQFRLIDKKTNSNFLVVNQFQNSSIQFDLSYVPLNYVPFAFDNLFISGTEISPLSSIVEDVTINFQKIKPSDSTLSNIILPSGTLNFPFIKPANFTIDGNNILVNIQANSESTDTEKITILDTRTITPFSELNTKCKTLQLNAIDGGGLFISDYWEYNNNLSDISDSTIPLGSDQLNYGDFSIQTKIAGSVNVIGITNDKIKVLLNTTGESFGQSLINANAVEGDSRILHVLSQDGVTIDRNFPNLKVTGGDFTTPKIADVPVLITTTPISFPVPPYANQATLYSQNIFPNDNISISTNNVDVKYDIFNAFKNPNVYDSSSILNVGLSGNIIPIIGSPYYNGIYNVNYVGSSSTNSDEHNTNFIDISLNPVTIEINLVELSPGNLGGFQNNFNQQLLLSNGNDKITLTWDGLNYDPSIQGDIYWTIERFNTQNETSKTVTQVVPSTTQDGSSKRFYTYVDRDITIYDKYIYKITGEFRWYPYGEDDIGGVNETARVLTLDVPFGMNGALQYVFDEMIVCKFNRFPFGRFNTTATNLKLYRPLLLNTEGGQVDQFGRQMANCGANGLFGFNRQISSSNNIYANTTNQTSKKLTYSRLSKNINRPYR